MKVLLVGAGKFGRNYVNALIDTCPADVEFVGVVEKYFETSPNREKLLAAGIPVFETMEDFYKTNSADLCCICTPPFLHAEQSVYAVRHGSDVLCEKPVAPTVEEAERMRDAEKRTGRFIAIGFQWSFHPVIQAIKKDMADGVYGKPISFKTLISWPRGNDYYNEKGWNGKAFVGGAFNNDSIAFNACAHYIHNMLFLLGDKPDTAAEVEEMEADCRRAYDCIDTYDTCFLKMKAKGCEMKFIASHVANPALNPIFEYTFEKGTIRYSHDAGFEAVATMRDGSVRSYGILKNEMTKLFDVMEAVRTGTKPVCTVETAIPHARLLERMYHEVKVKPFPAEKIVLTEKGRYVEGLYEEMLKEYHK